MQDLLELSARTLEIQNRPYLRYFLRENSLESRLSIISGPRGIGKSTVLVQHLLRQVSGDVWSDRILYVAADHFLVRKYNLYEIAEWFSRRGGQIIAFDEIHRTRDWSMQLKSIHDTFPDLKVLASGSSALEIHKGTHDLSRRAVAYRMHGLSFREFVELQTGLEFGPLPLSDLLGDHRRRAGAIARTLDAAGFKVLALFADYLVRGFYPYFLDLSSVPLFQRTLEQQVHTTIESDLLSIHPSLGGESIRKIKHLLSVVASSVPFTPDLNAVKQAVEVVDTRTLKTYLKYLEDAGILRQLHKPGRPFDALRKPEKIYLHDTNQLFALAPANAGNVGTVRETFFAQALLPLHELAAAREGDFMVDGRWVFEVGGKSKKRRQIKNVEEAWLAVDDLENGIDRTIPLWLFGWGY